MVTASDVRERLSAVPGTTMGEQADPLVAVVSVSHWRVVGEVVKGELGFEYFSFLSAIDWKDEGLEVMAWVDHLDARLSLLMKTRLGAGATVCPSLTSVYRGATWMERECFDMFGITFDGHPDPRRILLPDDWVGHPLLKSYDVDTPHPPYR